MINKKTMPYNLEAEQAVLGCILLDHSVASDIIAELKPYDFLVESHKVIFDAICNLNLDNKVVDIVTVADYLQKTAKLESIGGISYITELTNVIPSSVNYNEYLEIVKRDGIFRRLIDASNGIIEDATTSLDGKASLNRAEQAIFDISQSNDRRSLENLADHIDSVIDMFENLQNNENYSLGLKTGFRRFDYMTNGLHKGNLIILAARPSVGKTTLAMNIVENIAIKEKKTVAVFALEMTRGELGQRMVCSLANVNMGDALKGKLAETDSDALRRLWNAKKSISNANIYIDESTEVTPQDILSKCRRLKARLGLDLIVVDHIQLMQPARRNPNRQQEVTEISRGLKNIAKELDVPVLALSQLSRAVTNRPDGKPVLSDLRESGSIEQDADLVVFIHRAERDEKTKNQENVAPGHTELLIRKNRNGSCGDIPLVFKGEYVKFVSVDDGGVKPPPERINKNDAERSYDQGAEAEDLGTISREELDSFVVPDEVDPIYG
ncbi:MAG: replicative DNA helicase [Christensenellaceae bacterium]